ncbi:hypothetical protein Tco_0488271 [Tanacetum coccineum]
MPTEMELTLEQTQQGVSYEVSVDPHGFEGYLKMVVEFWDTVKAKTVNGEVQLQALVDKKKVIITESTIRRDLQLEDANGVDCVLNAGRKIADIDVDVEVTLINETHGRNDDNLMFDTCVLEEQEVKVEKVVSTAKVTTESVTITTVDELTLAQTLIEIKAAKPKKPLKKKDQIMYDQEVALNLQAQLQAELEEEERLTRQKEEEDNIALIESWDNTQAMMDDTFDKAFKRVNTFVDYKTELVEGSEKGAEDSTKRAGTELEQEVAKKQKIDDAKVDDNQEEARMKELINIVPDEEEVAIDAIPLATEPPCIEFCREDLETLWKLVKAKHSPVWRTLQNEKVLIWKLFDSCGVHFMMLQSMHIFMLVEKRYPLTPVRIIGMLNKKLQGDHGNEMCYQLLKLITKQLKNPGSV